MSVLLHSLGEAGQQLAALNDPTTTDASARLPIVTALALGAAQVEESRSITGEDNSELWAELAENKVAPTDVARALGAVMALAPQPQALQAAVVYTNILTSPGCPVSAAIGHHTAAPLVFPSLLALCFIITAAWCVDSLAGAQHVRSSHVRGLPETAA